MKKFLLDTHTFVWWVENSPQLSMKAKKTIENRDNECYLSLVSSWELAIKSSIGKLKLSIPVAEYIPQHLAANDFQQLNISFRHIAKIETLEFHHRDPFDRLLVAQTIEEKMSLISADKTFDLYNVPRVW